jgi:hypothetical protein
VVSDGPTAADTGVWADTTRIVRRAEAHAAVAGLKAEAGGGTAARPALPTPMRLLESRTRPDSDNVLLRYDVRRG